MAKLIWTLRAATDLEQICDHIALSSEYYARLFAERIMARIEALPSNPLIGSIVPEYKREDLRERVFQG